MQAFLEENEEQAANILHCREKSLGTADLVYTPTYYDME